MRRIAIFSHDSYGLGHLRRSLLIAEAAVAADERLDCLVVTGSPRALAFRLPDRVDAVKIPSITKAPGGGYVSRKLVRSRNQILALRSAITTGALDAYEPDLVLVDHSPIGADGELLPVLDHLRRSSRRPRLVLGLRDIIDDARTVDRQWTKSGAWRSIDVFDEVLVYGDRSIRTTADELDLANRVDAPVTTTGYVAPRMPDAQSGEPFVLVTAGGGGDGQRLIRRVLDLVEAGQMPLTVRVVSGPLLSKSRQAELITRAHRLDQVELTDFTPDLRQWVSSATAMVSMAGYNTTVEALASGTPTLLVPRSDFRQEQRIRSRRISEIADHVESVSDAESLDGDHLRRLLEMPRGSATAIDLRGATSTAERLLDAVPVGSERNAGADSLEVSP